MFKSLIEDQARFKRASISSQIRGNVAGDIASVGRLEHWIVNIALPDVGSACLFDKKGDPKRIATRAWP
ncbi:hypothetical protein GHK69_17345 [Sinorhizobium meliloti]|nr:hypothetical protein [Sinorhizobium meliloti]